MLLLAELVPTTVTNAGRGGNGGSVGRSQASNRLLIANMMDVFVGFIVILFFY